MSNWRHKIVDGAKFRINCKQTAFLSSFSLIKVIQNLVPSTIVLFQCDIRIKEGYRITQFLVECGIVVIIQVYNKPILQFLDGNSTNGITQLAIAYCSHCKKGTRKLEKKSTLILVVQLSELSASFPCIQLWPKPNIISPIQRFFVIGLWLWPPNFFVKQSGWLFQKIWKKRSL